MAVVQVVYKLGTKYIIESLEGAFRGILSNARDNGDIVDLCFARLCPTCAATLRSYYGEVELINSKEPLLDSILKQNAVNAKQTKELYPLLTIPSRPNYTDWQKTVTSLPKGSKWSIDVRQGQEARIAFAVLLILKCPYNEYDISASMQAIYDFVVADWIVHSVPHQQYIELNNGSIIQLTVDENGKLGDELRGMLPYRQYVSSHCVLPAEFGQKDLVQFENGRPIGEWADVIHKCVRALTSQSVGVKHLADYLKIRKV